MHKGPFKLFQAITLLNILQHMFYISIMWGYIVVPYTKNGWVSTATNCIHLPLIRSVADHMGITKSYPACSIVHQQKLI